MVTVFDMQSIPSLIGAGTAVAAAATGLVFGQLAESELNTPHSSPSSVRRKFVTDHDFSKPVSFSRPGTSSAVSTAPPLPPQDRIVLPPEQQPTIPVNATSAQGRIPRRAPHAQITPTKPPATRRPLAKQGDSGLAVPIVEDPRDSVSSNGSWIRRLSIRPMSQHGSLRSSLGPDSPSIFSFGSAAPILSGSRESPQLPPNKLVKRVPGTRLEDAGPSKSRGSRAQMTLRRPATSHQRSATLQHQLNAEELPPLPKFSLDQQNRPRAKTVGSHRQKPASGPAGGERSRWKSFWHGRLTYSGTKPSPLKSVEGPLPNRRVRLEPHQYHQVYLVGPSKIIMDGSYETGHSSPHEYDSPARTDNGGSPQVVDNSQDPAETTPSKPPKRSVSMQFSSPTHWISKTGSLRRRKRGNDTNGNKRNVSTPYADGTDTRPDSKSATDNNARKGGEVSQAEADLAAIFRPPEMSHSLPSPLPPLSRLSSFHIDAKRLGSPSPSSGEPNETVPSPTTSIRVASHTSHTRTFERASTVGSSEYHRGFTSGDDDDTDFKTDTPFDSFRTVASGRKRVLDGSLEFMFDDSPPSTAGNNIKPKRLSIQEILGPSFDGGDQIMEEDESAPTPIRATYEEFEADFRAASIEGDDKFIRGPTVFQFPADADDGRLSLDDDDDDDDMEWTKQDEMGVYNHLSPPSSMNSRRGSPNIRATLGSISGNAKSDVHFDSASERPRSTVFDWTEPPVHDKREKNGFVHRPKTVHGKQELDIRGGRSASRKGPVAAHVRSQSVPAVPDPTDTAKSTLKFGTWGLGQKNVSEDWDNDFEFEEEDDGSATGLGGEKSEHRFSMLVPASIQAAQPTVKAHSGQIRELSLLVNDLKRLCRLGREMNMLNSFSAQLWHEAEGIIALASPDEDTEGGDTDNMEDSDFAAFDERYIETGFDGSSLDAPINPSRRNLSPSRRRSAFMPDDDIFGTWDNFHGAVGGDRPKTPNNPIAEPRSTSVARSVMESMHTRRVKSDVDAADDIDSEERSNGKLNFDTNSLKELVKRAGDLRDSLSELVRREDHITQSPVRTPKHTRADGSPAFTRVFDDPSTSPTRRLANHNKPALNSTSPSNGISRRMQMMTVS